MFEWLAQNSWAIWLTAAAALAVTEMVTLDFTLIMLAAGALAGAGAAFLFPGLWLVHVLVALAVAGLLLGILRPTLLAKVRNSVGYQSSVAKMVGSSGRAVSEITAAGGEVKVAGEVWSARSFDSSTIPAGTPVEVYEVDGTTAVVYPREDNPQLR